MNKGVYISLGSNQGDSVQILRKAYVHIQQEIGEIKRKSSFYESEPWGFVAENNFVNTVILVETGFKADQVLEKLMEIEQKLGRLRTGTKGYQSRLIDLDIVAIDNQIIDADDLQIPHPRMHLRTFVLLPLKEINPEWIHPVSGKRIEQLIDEISDGLGVNKMDA